MNNFLIVYPSIFNFVNLINISSETCEDELLVTAKNSLLRVVKHYKVEVIELVEKEMKIGDKSDYFTINRIGKEAFDNLLSLFLYAKQLVSALRVYLGNQRSISVISSKSERLDG